MSTLSANYKVEVTSQHEDGSLHVGLRSVGKKGKPNPLTDHISHFSVWLGREDKEKYPEFVPGKVVMVTVNLAPEQ